jgi:hypothetical protein
MEGLASQTGRALFSLFCRAKLARRDSGETSNAGKFILLDKRNVACFKYFSNGKALDASLRARNNLLFLVADLGFERLNKAYYGKECENETLDSVHD